MKFAITKAVCFSFGAFGNSGAFGN